MKNKIILPKDLGDAQANRVRLIWEQLPVSLCSVRDGTYPAINASLYQEGQKRIARWLRFTPQSEPDMRAEIELYGECPKERCLSDSITVTRKRVDMGDANPERYILTAHAITPHGAHMAHHAILDIPVSRIHDLPEGETLLYKMERLSYDMMLGWFKP